MKNKTLFRMKRSAKIGTYSFVMVAVVLAVLIVANLLVGALPAKVTRFDTSNMGLTEISDETAKFVSKMDEDVTIYWLCENGEVDEQFRLLLTRYEEAGKHIKVEVVDPLANPTFTKKYSESTLSAFSFIVESESRFTILDFTDMYYFVNPVFEAAYQMYPQYIPQDLLQPMSLASLESACAQYGDMVAYMLAQQGYSVSDITAYNTVYSFCGEAKLTAALDYVTQEYIPHAYLITGHEGAAEEGKEIPPKQLTELLNSMGMDLQELNLQVAQSVPADANCLILFAPESDLSAHEATLIKDYVNAGGSLMLTTAPGVVESCPNLQSITALFGLTAAPGLVEEGDTSFIQGSRFTLVPTVSTEHTATAYVSSGNFKPQMPNSHAITVAETLPTGVTVTPLFTTSDKANRVSVADTSVTLGTAGKLHVAVAATKSIPLSDGTADTAHLTWFGSAEAFTDKYAEATSGGNYYFFGATASFMSEPFISAYEELAAVPLTTQYLAGLNDGAIVSIAIVAALVLPIGLLVTGIVIWVKRKRR